MAAPTVLNLVNCGITGNLGSADCGINANLFNYALFIPKGTVIPASAMTTVDELMEYIQTQCHADTVSARYQRSPLIVNLDDKTEDAKSEDRDGRKLIFFEGPWALDYQLSGTVCDYKTALRVLNNKQSFYDVLFFDANNVLWGTSKTDADGAQGIGGYSLFQLYVKLWKVATKDKPATYRIMFNMNSNAQYQQNLAWVDCSAAELQAPDLTPLEDVTLVAGTTSPNTTSAIYVAGYLGCGGENLGDLYGTILNDATAWSVKNAATGAAPSLTGVTYNSTLKQFVIASSTAFTSGQTFNINLAAPSVLIGLSESATLATPVSFSVTIP